MPLYEPFDPRASDADTAVEEELAAASSHLASFGFEVTSHWLGEGPPSSRLVLLLHARAGDTAMLVSINGPGVALRYLEYESRFADEAVLTTSNSPVPAGTFVQNPKNKQLQFSGVKDPNALYELHCAAIQAYFSSLRKEHPSPTEVNERLASDTAAIFERQVASGRMRRTDEPRGFAPTLVGAFHMVWRNAIPVGTVRRLLLRRRMRQEQKRLAASSPVKG